MYSLLNCAIFDVLQWPSMLVTSYHHRHHHYHHHRHIFAIRSMINKALDTSLFRFDCLNIYAALDNFSTDIQHRAGLLAIAEHVVQTRCNVTCRVMCYVDFIGICWHEPTDKVVSVAWMWSSCAPEHDQRQFVIPAVYFADDFYKRTWRGWSQE